jgi:hypothetical protein
MTKQRNKQTNRKTQMAKKKKGKTSEADSFRNTKIKISYTPEDGHICRNM